MEEPEDAGKGPGEPVVGRTDAVGPTRIQSQNIVSCWVTGLPAPVLFPDRDGPMGILSIGDHPDEISADFMDCLEH